MKNKWGWGIGIFYSSFVILMVGFVFFSRGVNIDLVRDDYYQGDIDFQKKYDKLKNAHKLKKDLWVDLDKTTKEIVLEFPKEMKNISGNILLYRAEDKRLDFKLPIKLEEGNIQKIPMSIRKKGNWKVNVDWKGDGVKYFKEEDVYN